MLSMGVNIPLRWPAINHPHMIEVLKSSSFTSKPAFIITNIPAQDYHKRFILWATELTAVADFIFLFHVVKCRELRNRSVEVPVPALFHSLSTGTHLAIHFQHFCTWCSVWIYFFFYFQPVYHEFRSFENEKSQRVLKFAFLEMHLIAHIYKFLSLLVWINGSLFFAFQGRLLQVLQTRMLSGFLEFQQSSSKKQKKEIHLIKPTSLKTCRYELPSAFLETRTSKRVAIFYSWNLGTHRRCVQNEGKIYLNSPSCSKFLKNGFSTTFSFQKIRNSWWVPGTEQKFWHPHWRIVRLFKLFPLHFCREYRS